MPKDQSVVRPGSRCPLCGHPIRWYDNIPVLSFLLLAGRCRDCRGAIPFRYPIVEVLTGILFAVIAGRFGLTFIALKCALFVAMMLILGFSDLTDRLLPDEITLGGAALGLVFSFIKPLQPGAVALVLGLMTVPVSPRLVSLAESLTGALIAAGVLYLIAEIYYRVRFREGMGLGDVKMMAMIGAFFGLREAVLALMFASILGAVVGLLFILIFRKGTAYELPFGTFLAFASILQVVV
jgi:leader peptidase (prepilin peptidase)/N-methyltransferase